MQPGQPYFALMLSFLDVVPDELFFQPRCLPSGHLDILTCGVMVDGKPLATFAADNGFHQDVIRALRPGADARDKPI